MSDRARREPDALDAPPDWNNARICEHCCDVAVWWARGEVHSRDVVGYFCPQHLPYGWGCEPV